MTPQELSMLEDLLQRLAAVHGVQKDPQADALIRERLAGQPDALYLLTQRTLLLEHALQDAQRQLAQRAAAPADPGGAAFLQRGLEPGFGRDTADPDAYNPGRSAYRGAPSGYAPGAPAAAPAAAPGWRERLFGAAPAAAPAPSSGPSFLGQAASAAAGVAGGMFLFNGIEHLMGNRGGGGGGGFLGLGGGVGTPEVIENVTQNFYEDRGSSGGGDTRQLADDAGGDWSGFDGGSFDDDPIV
ncbi:DUF2076 family protein [Pseudacidovorax sp. RU35E]|uniref:DUF2076 family protein n=1 Tax=Pseudacidovorax sp. RU35E TaxID=1907403 RepID=UPI00095559FF|nr:DUF2076 family protein [Pseudacidovorax sp. RU35E]SIR31192.1 hypothetical protein SAMN05880557_109227 [Pseudacidovorax sp. RU35E]